MPDLIFAAVLAVTFVPLAMLAWRQGRAFNAGAEEHDAEVAEWNRAIERGRHTARVQGK